MVSVRLGARETMRRTGCGILTLRPVSSLTSRKAGGSVGEARAALCARDGAAAQEKTTRVAQARTARRDGGNFLKQFPTILARIFPKNEKAPRDSRGLPPSPFLAKSAGRCAKGGWPGLRLLQADHSGGTAADSHGLPRFPGSQLKIQSKPRVRECQCRCLQPATPEKGGESAVLSVWVCAFDQPCETCRWILRA